MTLLQDQKEALRKAVFARRKQAHEQALAGSAGLLSEVLAGHRGVPVSGYLPIRTEIDPLPAMEEACAHGPVGVPVMQGAQQPLLFRNWEPGIELERGPFGVPIPVPDSAIEPEILIVPLVAFDLKGGRLGYGGGFYDRTLELLRHRRGVLAIGFAYDVQEIDAVPVEPTDQRLDYVVTESRVIRVT